MVSGRQLGRWAFGVALLSGTLCCASCQQVLGIKDAQLDPESDLCATYCDAALADCTGALAVYTNRETCLGFCGVLPLGTTGDETGNSASCRLTQAAHALDTGEPETHCPLAGPAGDGTCGSNCDSFCVVFAEVCPSDFAAAYADQTACLTGCAANIPDLGTYNSSMSSGDNVQCRLWHLAAASVDPSIHCTHAAGHAPCVAM